MFVYQRVTGFMYAAFSASGWVAFVGGATVKLDQLATMGFIWGYGG